MKNLKMLLFYVKHLTSKSEIATIGIQTCA